MSYAHNYAHLAAAVASLSYLSQKSGRFGSISIVNTVTQSLLSVKLNVQDHFQIVDHKQLEDQSIMKIAAVLFILSVCYIASTEQAAVPTGVHTYAYPSRPWKEMQRKAQQGMEEFNMKAKAFSQNTKAQVDVPTNPQELNQCANMDCPGSE